MYSQSFENRSNRHGRRMLPWGIPLKMVILQAPHYNNSLHLPLWLAYWIWLGSWTAWIVQDREFIIAWMYLGYCYFVLFCEIFDPIENHIFMRKMSIVFGSEFCVKYMTNQATQIHGWTLVRKNYFLLGQIPSVVAMMSGAVVAFVAHLPTESVEK